jgi:uncharacterized protein (UPF0262 family)
MICYRTGLTEGTHRAYAAGAYRGGGMDYLDGDKPKNPATLLIDIQLDENSIARNTPEVDHERKIAIFDLLDHNSFALDGGAQGPYRLRLSIAENRLAFDIACEAGEPVVHLLSLAPFSKLIKDYFLVCESYYEAIKTAPPSRIEALDMGRRGLHDEGSHLLIERLKGKITTDFETARRLFTLICALHWRG